MSDLGNLLNNLGNELGQLRGEQAAMRKELAQLKVEENVVEDWLQIPFRVTTLGIGATSVLTSRVGGDGPFDLIEITHTAVNAGGNANDNFRVIIREGESVGRALSQDQAAIDAANTSGTAQLPYIIKGRRRFRSNITITVEITNTDAAANTIELVLHGIKVFTR